MPGLPAFPHDVFVRRKIRELNKTRVVQVGGDHPGSDCSCPDLSGDGTFWSSGFLEAAELVKHHFCGGR
jgi:hypothetical protein